MRMRSLLAAALLCCVIGVGAPAQNQPASTVRTLLATGRIGSVVDTPLYFRLLSGYLAAGQSASYSGPDMMLYLLAGSLESAVAGAAQPLIEGGGGFIPAGRAARFSASEPAKFLLFVLSPDADHRKPLLGPPAAVEELYRSPEPLPGLQPGPYEFSLTRVSLPPKMPVNPPHYRSGAVLYYVDGGTGLFIADGKTEAKPPGSPHFERAGWVHQWANPGDTHVLLIQANISQEGVPAVMSVGAR
jgi:quercetin dioxygenase-like cupin family protein